MAEARKIFTHLPAAIPMVGSNGISRCRRAVDDGHRAINAGNACATSGNDHHAVHPALDQPVDRIRLHGDLTARIGDQHAITRVDSRLLDGLRNLWKERIGNIGQDEPENARSAGAKRPARRTRHIAQLARRLADTFHQFGRNAALAGQRIGHGCHRHAECRCYRAQIGGRS
ncbi:UNVERIFIED_ORG: hypothetical protein QE446_000287 [Rhizobium sp. SORGH_AS260]|nr:hypothetical protein [Rhizobium sp. SORGH_AS_0260]